MRRPLPIAAALVLSLAALSLLLPYEPVYDPWGWLVWGRELARLELVTGDGLSWKPLPVLIDAPLSLLGEAAPQGWLLVARSGWLAAPLLAGWLAARLAGPLPGGWPALAAALAAGSVALTADAFTPAARQFSGGLSEPLLVALALGAVAAALERRLALALWLGVAASLLRPECWPFLAAWGAWAWRGEPRLRPQLLAAAGLLPLAWFVPDLLASGDPLQGSEIARGDGVEAGEALEVLGRALFAPLAAAWLGVAFLLLAPGRGGEDRALRILLVAAAAWIALVAAMAVAGFAGLPRFLAPATAAIAVLGGAGVARAGAIGFSSRGRHPAWAAATAAALVLGLAGLAVRAAEVPGELGGVRAQSARLSEQLELAERVGARRLLSCGGRVRLANLLVPPTALAWRLERPIGSVRVIPHPRYGVALSTRPLPGGRVFARAGRWRATQLPC